MVEPIQENGGVQDFDQVDDNSNPGAVPVEEDPNAGLEVVAIDETESEET